MAGSLKTEAIVLRSIRFGEADRVLHLYTPQRGRVSAIAKGVRRAKSRFGGRLEPFFRLDLVLYEGRSDLLTVTSAETLAGHPRLREDGRGARHRRPRLRRRRPAVRRRRPARRRLPPARQRARAARRRPGAGGPRQRARLPPQAAARRRLRAAARRLRLVRRAGAPRRASPAPPAAWSARPARRARSRSTRRAHDFLVEALGRPLAETPAAEPARARAGRAGDPRDAGASRQRAAALREHASRRIRRTLGDSDQPGSTTSPTARATCASCSAARARTSPR